MHYLLLSLLLSLSLSYTRLDPSSYSNMDEVVTSHLDLDLSVDFDNKRVTGISVLHMRTIKDITMIDLDF